jgi:glucose/arabinose dehydrogenase
MRQFIPVLLTFLISVVLPSQGEAQSVNLTAHVSRNTLTATSTAVDVQQPSCIFSLYGAPTRSDLSTRTDETMLTAIQASSQALFTIPELPSLRRKGEKRRRPLFLRVYASCGSENIASPTIRVNVPTLKRGKKPIRWLSTVRTQVLQSSLSLTRVFEQVEFDNPLFLTHAGDSSDRIFIVEQGGRIIVFPRSNPAAASTFLDISSLVSNGSEQGLLGLAFSPSFNTNGFFFVYYTNAQGNSVISRFTVSQSNPSLADAASEQIVLTFTQPFSNHNGGCLQFGPDGYLYIASGDGGSAGDPEGNAQKTTNLLGKLLRIDVSSLPYTVPVDNPFASGGGAPEIYALGLRNPWRFSFDEQTNRLWLGDVGQNELEEIDLIVAGGNYGWNVREGTQCFPSGNSCSTTGYIEPVTTYSREIGQSVTGGYVYRGTEVPDLLGVYIYGDFGSGRVFGLTHDTRTTVYSLFDLDAGISSFGLDQQGELYLLSYFSGQIFKMATKAVYF